MLRSIRVRNLFSFSENQDTVELGRLNILIGPSGSGKSNFLDTIWLYKELLVSVAGAIEELGGFRHCAFNQINQTAHVEAVVDYRHGNMPLSHSFSLSMRSGDMVFEERIENSECFAEHDKRYFYFGYEKGGRPMFNVAEDDGRKLRSERINLLQSVVAQRRDESRRYPELCYLADQYERICTLRNWTTGRTAAPRGQVFASAPSRYLSDDCHNLPLVINYLKREGALGDIINRMRSFFGDFEAVDTVTENGVVQLYIKDKAMGLVPAVRASDSMMRMLCLICALYHPVPPSLVAIDEPELGLTPRMVIDLADMLREASDYTQLVIATNSGDLADQFMSDPDNVLVFDRHDGATVIERCDTAKLEHVLEAL